MSRQADDAAIGGYLAQERWPAGTALPWHTEAFGFESARAAIAAVLSAQGATRAWIPHFVCGAVVDALAHAGVEVRRYALADDYAPAAIDVADEDWIVCVDYFGLSGDGCRATIDRHGGHRVLVDASQALFRAPDPRATTVYSPRKFAGLPDGGLVAGVHAVPPSSAADEDASMDRGRHLRARALGDVAGGFALFQAAEQTLERIRPGAMSATTRRLIAAVDFQALAQRRIGNYRLLSDALAAHGFMTPPLADGDVPRGCPVGVAAAAASRRGLADRAIYCAGYWPDATPPADDTVGVRLLRRTLYLPCDHRYGRPEMLAIAAAVAATSGAP